MWLLPLFAMKERLDSILLRELLEFCIFQSLSLSAWHTDGTTLVQITPALTLFQFLSINEKDVQIKFTVKEKRNEIKLQTKEFGMARRFFVLQV